MRANIGTASCMHWRSKYSVCWQSASSLCVAAQALQIITDLQSNIADETLAQIEAGHGLICKVRCSCFDGPGVPACHIVPSNPSSESPGNLVRPDRNLLRFGEA